MSPALLNPTPEDNGPPDYEELARKLVNAGIRPRLILDNPHHYTTPRSKA